MLLKFLVKKQLLQLLFLITVCQVSFSQSVLTEIIVAKDGTGKFTTIQEAVNAFPDWSATPLRIIIKHGVYKEKLVIPLNKTNIHLVGENRENTIITNSDYSGKAYPGKDPLGFDKFNTYSSYTVIVRGNDFAAENITFENASGPVGQAVALHIEADRCVVKNCKILGNQDTLFLGKDNTRQYFVDCYINGTTDFIFGASTAIFKNCEIFSKRTSYITAANTPQRQKYGFIFMNCKLTADSATKGVALGRPWRGYASTIFMNCYLGPHIAPFGWNNWSKVENEQTVRYAEYNNSGPGARTNERAKWAKQLSKKEAKRLTVESIFGDWQPIEKV